MKFFRIWILSALFVSSALVSWGLQGKIAAPEDVDRLKQDVVDGKIVVGETRLYQVKDWYGEPISINDNPKTVVYDYGDLKIEFSKTRYLRDWRYDSFKEAAYTDDIDALRKDLESKEIDGKQVTFDLIKKDYKEPTESTPSEIDEEKSIYYYGDIKLTFENNFVVKSVKGKNLEKYNKPKDQQETLGSKPPEPMPKLTETKDKAAAPAAKK